MGYKFPKDPKPLNKGKSGHNNPYYASMIDTVDYLIGDVINYLENTSDPRNPGYKLIDNTYLIVDSDNGGVLPYTDNYPLKGGKQKSHEGGVRIPFLVMGPNVPPGTTCNTMINVVDLFPTFMKIAGMKFDQSLDLDGCNILSLIHGSNDPAYFPNGKIRESMIWFYPMDSHSSIAMRKGNWKLIRNLGVSGGGPQKVETQLFRLYKEDGSVADISENHNVANQNPEILETLQRELDEHLAKHQLRMPYRSQTSKDVTEDERLQIPKVLSISAFEDQLEIKYETDKNKIVEAELYYTLNPPVFDSTRGNREEWFAAQAQISNGKVKATMPPGATHAIIVMRDSQNFIITSDKIPSYREAGYKFNESSIVNDQFSWQPGLYALIKLADKALHSAREEGLSINDLQSSTDLARKTYQLQNADDQTLANAIFTLRKSIRDLKGTPESQHPLINRFPTEPLF